MSVRIYLEQITSTCRQPCLLTIIQVLIGIFTIFFIGLMVSIDFNRIRDWLKGTFTCLKCGRVFHLFTFGYGKAICPDCYDGEQPWLFFQDPIMRRLFHG